MSEIYYNIQIQVDLTTEQEFNGIIKQLKDYLKTYREAVDMSDIEMSTEEQTDFFSWNWVCTDFFNCEKFEDELNAISSIYPNVGIFCILFCGYSGAGYNNTSLYMKYPKKQK